jgi:hypothetical protein
MVKAARPRQGKELHGHSSPRKEAESGKEGGHHGALGFGASWPSSPLWSSDESLTRHHRAKELLDRVIGDVGGGSCW